jgi:hypothetical protein
MIAFMAPKPLLRNERYLRARVFLLNRHELFAVMNFSAGSFRAASVETCALISRRRCKPRKDYSFDLIDLSSRPATCRTLSIKSILADELHTIRIESSSTSILLLERLKATCLPLGDHFDVKGGINPGRKDFRPYMLGRRDGDLFVPLAYPGQGTLLPHNLARPEQFDPMIHRPTLNGRDFQGLLPATFGDTYIRYRADMATQPDFYVPTTKWSAILGNTSYYDRPEKILVRQTASTLIATIDRDRTFPLNTVHVVFPGATACEYDCDMLVGILNSMLMRAVYRTLSEETGKIFPQVHVSALKRLPLPRHSTASMRERLSRAVVQIYRNGLSTEAMRQLDDIVFALYEVTESERAVLASLTETQPS